MTTALLLALALAGAGDDPSTRVTLLFDDVCASFCVEALEKGLGRLDGVLSVNGRGFREPEKFLFELALKESTALTPSTLLKAWKDTPLEDYPLLELTVAGLAGTVEKGVDVLRFTARGSTQRYVLKSSPALDALTAQGKFTVVLSGTVVQPGKGDPVIQVTGAVESK